MTSDLTPHEHVSNKHVLYIYIYNAAHHLQYSLQVLNPQKIVSQVTFNPVLYLCILNIMIQM